MTNAADTTADTTSNDLFFSLGNNPKQVRIDGETVYIAVIRLVAILFAPYPGGPRCAWHADQHRRIRGLRTCLSCDVGYMPVWEATDGRQWALTRCRPCVPENAIGMGCDYLSPDDEDSADERDPHIQPITADFDPHFTWA